MRLHRIYTEYRPNLADIVAKHFDGATILQGVGLWQGVTETCAIVELLTSDVAAERAKVRELAKHIRLENGQTAVYIVSSKVDDAELITAEAR